MPAPHQNDAAGQRANAPGHPINDERNPSEIATDRNPAVSLDLFLAGGCLGFAVGVIAGAVLR